MFTGIVEETGIIKKIDRRPNLTVLTIGAKKILKGTKKGDSIAIDGVCLTATSMTAHSFSCDVMRETLKKTTLGSMEVGDRVNLEGALKANDRLHGHVVSGHIDGIGKITGKETGKNFSELKIRIPAVLKKYIVPKGSICVNGISLTVGRMGPNWFSVHLIPYTAQVTNLSFKKKNDSVNIETDILAKYLLNK